MMLALVSNMFQTYKSKHQIIPRATIILLWFGRSTKLTSRWTKASLRVVDERGTREICMVSSDEDYDRIYMKSWNFWKDSYHFCQRQALHTAVLFAVSLFYSSFFFLISATILNFSTLTAVRYIPGVKSGSIMVVISLTSLSSLNIFCLSISICSSFISWSGMTFHLLTVSYTEIQRKIWLDYCWIHFSPWTTIWSSFLIYYTLIVEMFWHAIPLIPSALSP